MKKAATVIALVIALAALFGVFVCAAGGADIGSFDYRGFADNIAEAKYGYEHGVRFVTECFEAVKTNATVDKYVGMALDFVDQYLVWILIAVAVFELLIGCRSFYIQLFVVTFVAGTGVMLEFLCPVVESWGITLGEIGSIILSAVCAFILACVSKLIWKIGIIVGGTYAGYWALMTYCSEYMHKVITDDDAKKIVAACVALVVSIVVLILMKWVLIIGTSVGGGFLLAYEVVPLLSDVNITFPYINYVIAGVAALLGLFIQIKTRRRYY